MAKLNIAGLAAAVLQVITNQNTPDGITPTSDGGLRQDFIDSLLNTGAGNPTQNVESFVSFENGIKASDILFYGDDIENIFFPIDPSALPTGVSVGQIQSSTLDNLRTGIVWIPSTDPSAPTNSNGFVLSFSGGSTALDGFQLFFPTREPFIGNFFVRAKSGTETGVWSAWFQHTI